MYTTNILYLLHVCLLLLQSVPLLESKTLGEILFQTSYQSTALVLTIKINEKLSKKTIKWKRQINIVIKKSDENETTFKKNIKKTNETWKNHLQSINQWKETVNRNGVSITTAWWKWLGYTNLLLFNWITLRYHLFEIFYFRFYYTFLTLAVLMLFVSYRHTFLIITWRKFSSSFHSYDYESTIYEWYTIFVYFQCFYFFSAKLSVNLRH